MPEINTRVISDVAELRKRIKEANYNYYILDAPTMDDAEYDRLFQRLVELETAYPQLKMQDSPTNTVGSPGSETASIDPTATVKHLSPMLSLNNVFSRDDFERFHLSVIKTLTEPVEYCIEHKVDGLAINLIYARGRLYSAATRGIGTAGECVMASCLAMPTTIPSTLSGDDIPEWIEVRGEVFLSNAGLQRANERRERLGLVPYKNERNAAAGSLRSNDSVVAASLGLSFVAHGIGSHDCPLPASTYVDQINLLKGFGFATLPQYPTMSSTQIAEFIEANPKRIEGLPYPIDGLVIKVNDLLGRVKLGNTRRAPRWAVAYKFSDKDAETVVEDIAFQVSRLGTVTPVVKLRPVSVSGVTVSSALLHNEAEIDRLDVRIGDRVLVYRAGDVTPKIRTVLPTSDRHAAPTRFPECCPSCNGPLHKEETKWICPAKDCPAQVIQRLVHFTSRSAMNIKGLGESTITALANSGLVRRPVDLYSLTKDRVMSTHPEFSGTVIDKLLAEIAKSRQCDPRRLIIGLGIPSIGPVDAEKLAKAYVLAIKTPITSLLDVGLDSGMSASAMKSWTAYVSDEDNRSMLLSFKYFLSFP